MKIIAFQVVNYTLSFLMWMILARVIFTLMIGNRPNVMLNAFVKITEPVYRLTRRLAPFVKESCIPAVSILLILIARIVLVIIFKPGQR
jgi:uncharacterized membrane protein